jgi:uncharacterized pyridoxamine 5'-phosphate oxidase family protein
MIQNALEFLRRNYEVAFATCEGGKPHIRIFQVMKMEGTTLYFATSPEKEIYRQLCQNPAVELMATTNQEFVKCSGKADFDVDDATAQWIYDNNPVLPRLYTRYDKLAYFKIEIEVLDHYDLKPTPPVFKHYDLVNQTEGDGYVGERYSRKA